MTRVILTASEATAAHDGTLAEIRRQVEDPPRWWSFTPSLVGPEMPSGYRNVHASESTDPRLAGTFPRSIDPRDPQQPFAAPFGNREAEGRKRATARGGCQAARRHRAREQRAL